MSNQLTSNAEALRLFFTEDVYLVKDKNETILAEQVTSIIIKDEVKIIPPKVIYPVSSSADLPIVAEPDPKKEFAFEYLGKNEKKILILVNDKTNAVSSEEGRELLRKLVKAIGLANKDFALLNFSTYTDATFIDLKQFFNCELALIFGVTAQELDLKEQQLNTLVALNDTRFIFSKNLHELNSDQISKRTLWNSLQQLIP